MTNNVPEIRSRAQSALAASLAQHNGTQALRSTHSNYAVGLEDNLVPTVRALDFWDDLAQGDGNELADSGSQRPAKFCAAHSSAALAVNVFGPFRHSPGALRLLGLRDFVQCQFERKLSTGISTPNLDFFANGPSGVIALESKCTEYLHAKACQFSPRYEAVVNRLADPQWRALYHQLVENPNTYQHLDAAQLVKHYLGLRYSLPDAANHLLYIYWEPKNAELSNIFLQHRSEVDSFAASVDGGSVPFHHLTYSQLFDQWEANPDTQTIQEHVHHLRQRYDVII